MDGWARDDIGTVWTEIDSAALALQSSFWSERITTTAGVRHDTIKAWQTDISADPVTDEVLSATRRADPDTDESEATYTVGAVVALNSWLSVYGNRSTNFKDQPTATLYGDENEQPLVGPLKGTGLDAGLKFMLLNKRVYATLGWFKVEQSNQAVGFNGLVDLYVDAIWTAIANNGPGSEIREPHQASGGDTQAVESEGFELEVTANLTPNWRLLFNASKAENITTGIDARLISYVATHRGEWEQNRGLAYDTSRDPGNVGDNTVGALIDDLDSLIRLDQARNGRQEINARPWSANLFTSYTFPSGRLKNLTLGGGVNYRGDAILGIDQADPLNPKEVKGRSYYLVNAMAAYEFRWLERVTTRIQLNVDNLLDNDDLQVLASNYMAGRTNTLTYYFEPRRYTLSVTFGF